MRRIDPRLLVIAGAAFLSVSAILLRLSGVSSGTAAFFRCALALPVLAPLARWERRRAGPRRRAGVDVLARLLLGTDFVLWGASIESVGAGIASVLVNVQVVVVPLLALAVFGERPSRAFGPVVPVMAAGVALAGGLGGHGAGGSDPVRGSLFGVGAGVAYAGYLFLTRVAGRGQDHRAQPVLLSTLGVGAAALAIGGPWQGVDLAPGWPALGWLAALALTGQVCGWVLIGAALPRLGADVAGALLLLQPVLAVALGAVILGERPALAQLAGCGLVVTAIWLAGRGSVSPRDDSGMGPRTRGDARTGQRADRAEVP
ncbi:DMT family transporter [Actinomadura luteofluorescens]|uniref:DMT family transporter n=1 Tax=Actinomadura luteofluorescens TaxID=46163 RepID=UPI003483EB87